MEVHKLSEGLVVVYSGNTMIKVYEPDHELVILTPGKRIRRIKF